MMVSGRFSYIHAVDEELQKLHSRVEHLKRRKAVGVKYMQMQEVIERLLRDQSTE